jgi:hypothetical protein
MTCTEEPAVILYRLTITGGVDPLWFRTKTDAARAARLFRAFPELYIEQFELKLNKENVRDILQGMDMESMGVAARMRWKLSHEGHVTPVDRQPANVLE